MQRPHIPTKLFLHTTVGGWVSTQKKAMREQGLNKVPFFLLCLTRMCRSISAMVSAPTHPPSFLTCTEKTLPRLMTTTCSAPLARLPSVDSCQSPHPPGWRYVFRILTKKIAKVSLCPEKTTFLFVCLAFGKREFCTPGLPHHTVPHTYMSSQFI